MPTVKTVALRNHKSESEHTTFAPEAHPAA